MGRYIKRLIATRRAQRERERRAGHYRYFDYTLLVLIIFLSCFGLVMLYSTSSYVAINDFKGDSMYFFRHQGMISVGSMVCMMFVSTIDYHKLSKFAVQCYGCAIFLMMLVKFTPLGKEVGGARRWLRLPMRQTIQPSELMKIAVILLVPLILCKMGKKVSTLQGTLLILFIAGFSAFSVFYLTDNLSTGIIVGGIVCGMLFIVHKNTNWFIAILLAGIGLVYTFAYFLGRTLENSENFRIRRLLAWLNPEKYAANLSYQTVQGLYAIGAGGFFGKGFGNGVQKTVIPEVQTDFILAGICEELGLFGAILILLIFGMMIYRLIFIARNAPDLYGGLLVSGIAIHVALQVILNMAVVLNMIPNTGITLPFIMVEPRFSS